MSDDELGQDVDDAGVTVEVSVPVDEPDPPAVVVVESSSDQGIHPAVAEFMAETRERFARVESDIAAAHGAAVAAQVSAEDATDDAALALESLADDRADERAELEAAIEESAEDEPESEPEPDQEPIRRHWLWREWFK